MKTEKTSFNIHDLLVTLPPADGRCSDGSPWSPASHPHGPTNMCYWSHDECRRGNNSCGPWTDIEDNLSDAGGAALKRLRSHLQKALAAVDKATKKAPRAKRPARAAAKKPGK